MENTKKKSLTGYRFDNYDPHAYQLLIDKKDNYED